MATACMGPSCQEKYPPVIRLIVALPLSGEPRQKATPELDDEFTIGLAFDHTGILEMRLACRKRILVIALVLCLLAVSGLGAVHAALHDAHLGNHAPSHSTVLCFLACTTGQAIFSPTDPLLVGVPLPATSLLEPADPMSGPLAETLPPRGPPADLQ